MKYPLTRIFIISMVLAPFLFGTEPSLPPYHDFTVTGVLQRPAGGSRAGFTVVLCGKSRLMNDSTFQILRGLGYSTNDRPVALTDSGGAFQLRVSSYEVDTLALGVVVPDRPVQLGVPFPVKVSMATPHWETYKSGEATGCAGCATDPPVTSRVRYYSYYFGDEIITIPF